MSTRRNFIRSAAGLLIAAPMVVKADSLMRVASKPLVVYYNPMYSESLAVMKGIAAADAHPWQKVVFEARYHYESMSAKRCAEDGRRLYGISLTGWTWTQASKTPS